MEKKRSILYVSWTDQRFLVAPSLLTYVEAKVYRGDYRPP